MPTAPLWLALSAASRSLQGPPAFALTNWLWLRRAGWHDASPPFPTSISPPHPLCFNWALSGCLNAGTRHQTQKLGGKYKADKFPSCFDSLLEKRKKYIEYSNLDQSGSNHKRQRFFVAVSSAKNKEFKLELNNFLKLLDYSYGPTTAKGTHWGLPVERFAHPWSRPTITCFSMSMLWHFKAWF